MNLLWVSSTAQGGPIDLASIGITGGRWSSTEYSQTGAMMQNFNTGFRGSDVKTIGTYRVRCVRR